MIAYACLPVAYFFCLLPVPLPASLFLCLYSLAYCLFHSRLPIPLPAMPLPVFLLPFLFAYCLFLRPFMPILLPAMPPPVAFSFFPMPVPLPTMLIRLPLFLDLLPVTLPIAYSSANYASACLPVAYFSPYCLFLCLLRLILCLLCLALPASSSFAFSLMLLK